MIKEEAVNSQDSLNLEDVLNFYADIGRYQFLAKVECVSCNFEEAVSYYELAVGRVYNFTYNAITSGSSWCEFVFLQQFPEFKDAVSEATLAAEMHLLHDPQVKGSVTVYCPRGCNQTTVSASNPWDECAACGQVMHPDSEDEYMSSLVRAGQVQ